MTFPLLFADNGYGDPAVWDNTDPERPRELDGRELVELVQRMALDLACLAAAAGATPTTNEAAR